MKKAASTHPDGHGRPKWLLPTLLHNHPKRWNNLSGVVVATFKVPCQTTSKNSVNLYPDHNGGSVCWWDGHEFSTAPVGCPMSHDELHNEFHLQGYFCSWACVRAWSQHYMKGSAQMMVPGYIKMIQRVTHHPLTDVLVAPHWCVLQRFGGRMTIEEYRSLPALKQTTGVSLQVHPESARIYMSGFDCFVEDPRIQVPKFSLVESKYVQVDHDGCYVFPKMKRKADGHGQGIKHSRECQTPVDAKDWEPAAGDRVLAPFKPELAPTSKKRKRMDDKHVQLEKPVPTAASRKKASIKAATKYLKTSKAMKHALNQGGSEALYRQYRVVNPVVKCMNIKVNAQQGRA